ATWGQANRLSRVLIRVCYSRSLSQLKVGPESSYATSTRQVPTSHQNCNVELGVTHDGKAIVCFHRAVDTAFELTKPISRPDTISDSAETPDLVLKSKLTGEISKNEQNPTIEELSKMFYTTKHCWYPVGHDTILGILSWYNITEDAEIEIHPKTDLHPDQGKELQNTMQTRTRTKIHDFTRPARC
ncbi:hypothetical protein NFI96_011668, partial [Prochilodus magdalenae]